MKNRTIKEQLLIWFLVFTVIPLAVISSWCFTLASDIIRNKSISYASESIKQLSDNIDQLLLQIETTSLSISYNNYVQDILQKLHDGDVISRVDSFQLEKNMILTYDYSSMRDITIRTEESSSADSLIFRVPSSLLSEEQKTLYPEDILPLPTQGPLWRSLPEQQVIQMVRNIDSTKNFEHIGTLYISIYNGYMNNLVRNINFDEKGFVLILDENNHPINELETNPAFLEGIDEKLEEASGSFSRSIDSVSYRYFYTTSPKTGWKSVGIISVSDLHAQVRTLGLSIIVGIFLVSLIAVLISSRLSTSFAGKIHSVTEAMKRAAEGDFSVQLAEGISKNEFNDLNVGFNYMIRQINSLIETVYHAELLKKEAEYAALQAQVNPHFLYNTLDTICWQAKLSHNDEIFDTTYALAALLRGTMSNRDPFVTVEQEIEYVNAYIRIQKSRYRDKISASIAIEPKLMPFKIPKLILQPVVENAFVHGLEEKCGPGHVRVRGIHNQEEGMAVFMIQDDGVGMTQEQIRRALDSRSEEKGGFGLSSTHKRIRLLYGDSYGLSIQSEPQKGTTVIIRLPAKE